MNIRISRYSVGSLESKSMEYTASTNLKRHRLSKDPEKGYIHEKRRNCDNEAIVNYFVRSYLVTITAIINSKTPRKPRSEAVVQKCSVKKVFLEISQNSQENTSARVCF